ncbi:MAG: nucleotidyltransferase domain-containing protein [Candidatus Methanospirareceae archaeon]
MTRTTKNDRGLLEQLEADFKEFAEGCMGIVLFGSYAEGEQTKRSDIDVCIVKPEEGVVDAIYAKLGGKYDLTVFERLPLYIKLEVIRNHDVVVGDELALSAFFYFYRKLWQDMGHRMVENAFKTVGERMSYRRRWLHEKKKILREIGSL